MIFEIASGIPKSLANVSGKVFYSGRDAFQSGRPVYLLGYNPAGNPNEHSGETVASHTRAVLEDFTSNWSAYRDESWLSRGRRRAAGTATFQPVLLQLMYQLGIDPGLLPSSNLVFTRSARAADLSSPEELECLCWPFHANAIEMIRPRFVICLGLKTGRLVCSWLKAHKQLDRFEEPNNRRWISDARATTDGLVVFTLTHPSQTKWTTSETDPRPMVLRVYRARA